MRVPPVSSAPRGRTVLLACTLLLFSIASPIACARQDTAPTAGAVDVATAVAAVAQSSAPMSIQPGIPLDLAYVDKRSPAFSRFKRWVDAAVGGKKDDEQLQALKLLLDDTERLESALRMFM